MDAAPANPVPGCRIWQAECAAEVPTGKKRGGQPGHPQHLKSFLPSERVKEFFDHEPECCAACDKSLSAVANDPGPKRHQVAGLRRAVLWRKKSFGCASQGGCRFVERILTVVQTLRLQKRNALEFLSRSNSKWVYAGDASCQTSRNLHGPSPSGFLR